MTSVVSYGTPHGTPNHPASSAKTASDTPLGSSQADEEGVAADARYPGRGVHTGAERLGTLVGNSESSSEQINAVNGSQLAATSSPAFGNSRRQNACRNRGRLRKAPIHYPRCAPIHCGRSVVCCDEAAENGCEIWRCRQPTSSWSTLSHVAVRILPRVGVGSDCRLDAIKALVSAVPIHRQNVFMPSAGTPCPGRFHGWCSAGSEIPRRAENRRILRPHIGLRLGFGTRLRQHRGISCNAKPVSRFLTISSVPSRSIVCPSEQSGQSQ